MLDNSNTYCKETGVESEGWAIDVLGILIYVPTSKLHSIINIADLVQQGMSEKVPISVSFFSAFCTGLILAYVRSWPLALALTSITPRLMIVAIPRT